LVIVIYKKENTPDKLHKIQQQKMKELWNNKEDEVGKMLDIKSGYCSSQCAIHGHI